MINNPISLNRILGLHSSHPFSRWTVSNGQNAHFNIGKNPRYRTRLWNINAQVSIRNIY